MLVICLRDGLTCNEKVYERGDSFILSEKLHDEYGGLTPPQIARKQKDIYGFELFRPATEEETWDAYKVAVDKNAFMEKLESAEKHVVGRFLGSAAEKIKAAADVMNPEEEVEEDESKVEPVVQESSMTEIKAPPKKATKKAPRKSTRKTSAKK